jgi:arylsulfatase A
MKIISLLFFSYLSIFASDKPNILLILTDDMGIGDVKAYNPSSVLNTPVLNKFCEQSLIFTDMHSPAPTCTASRYGIMTGRYIWRDNIKSKDLEAYSKSIIAPSSDTLANLLKRHGYRTALMGKWHLGINWPTKEDTEARPIKGSSTIEKSIDFTKNFTGGPLDHGFDSWFGLVGSLDKPPYAFMRDRKVDQTLNKFSPRHAGQDFGTPELFRQEGLSSHIFEPQRALSKIINEAKSFIKSSTPEKPFFLFLSLPVPHRPVIPRHPFLGSSRAGIYGDFIHEIDWSLGQILESLDQQNISENTLVIFTSDNGSSVVSFDYDKAEYFRHRPNHIYKGRAGSLFEGGHRVPFIVRWPKNIKNSSEIKQTSSLNDIYATCAELLSETITNNTAEDSTSLLPLMLNKPKDYAQFQFVYQDWKQAFALRYNKWKLILSHDLEKRAIYDLDTDPSERQNLYQDNPDIVRHLSSELSHIIRQGRSTPGEAVHLKDNNFDFYWEEQFNEYEYSESSDSPVIEDASRLQKKSNLLD